jgi:hypothetical protein
MATWKKSPPELVAAFDAALASEPHARRRQMFGYPCAFVNGRMAVGLHEDRVIARVPDEAERRPCIILGRRMKEYAAVDFDTAMQGTAMQSWVGRAVAYTATLPPKAAKTANSARSANAAKPARTAKPPTAAKSARSKPAPARARPKR